MRYLNQDCLQRRERHHSQAEPGRPPAPVVDGSLPLVCRGNLPHIGTVGVGTYNDGTLCRLPLPSSRGLRRRSKRNWQHSVWQQFLKMLLPAVECFYYPGPNTSCDTYGTSFHGPNSRKPLKKYHVT